MSTPKNDSPENGHIPSELANYLGVRRTMTLRRIMRQSGLPAEVVLDLALELLDIASRKLAPSPMNRQAVGLGAARWRNVSPEERSEAFGAPLRRAGPSRGDRLATKRIRARSEVRRICVLRHRSERYTCMRANAWLLRSDGTPIST